MNGSGLFPEQASTLAPKVDALFFAMMGVTGAVAITVVVLLVWFSLKYRQRSKADRRTPPEGARKRSRRLELAWILTPLLLFVAAFIWGSELYFEHAAAPRDALQIFVVARQWMWKAQHTDGRREINELHVPRGYSVQLVMTSEDVIHSFFVPAFRVKQDVLPGRYTSLWFLPTKAGEFHLFCAEYCGTDHARMGGRIVVLEAADYQRWLSAHAGPATMAAHGAALFRQYGCSGCHAAGATVRAPRLEGLFGKPVPLAGGGTVIADERYLRDSILLPRQDLVAGYEPIMPSFAGQLSEEDLLDLVAYIKSLADKEPGTS